METYMNTVPSNIKDFPAAIARTQNQILAEDRHVRNLQEDTANLTAQIDATIAFDQELKNDAQRKAMRLKLMNCDEYQERLSDLQIAQDKRTSLQIQLELLRNEFSILKLEQRERIAEMELQSQAA
jgi:hypothetical protein